MKIRLPAPGGWSKERNKLISQNRIGRFIQKTAPGSRLVGARVLHGGISADMVLCEIMTPGGSLQKWILRQPNEQLLALHPQSARDEYLLLQHLRPLQLGAPIPIALDESGDAFPSAVMLMEYIEGGLDFSRRNASSMAYQMGRRLARIHSVDHADAGLSFLPQSATDLEMTFGGWPLRTSQLNLDTSLRQKLKTAWPFHNPNPPSLLHGDFWPGNMLWHQGQLAGVVDWEDAMLGDPLIDLSICRLDLLCIFDRETMRIFTEAYLAHHAIDAKDLAAWDLIAALRLARLAGTDLVSWCAFYIPYGRSDITPSTIKEAFNTFVAEAFSLI